MRRESSGYTFDVGRVRPNSALSPMEQGRENRQGRADRRVDLATFPGISFSSSHATRPSSMSSHGLRAKDCPGPKRCRTQSSASSTRCGVSAMPGTQYSVCISALEHDRCNCENLGYEQGGEVDRYGWGSECFDDQRGR